MQELGWMLGTSNKSIIPPSLLFCPGSWWPASNVPHPGDLSESSETSFPTWVRLALFHSGQRPVEGHQLSYWNWFTITFPRKLLSLPGAELSCSSTFSPCTWEIFPDSWRSTCWVPKPWKNQMALLEQLSLHKGVKWQCLL